MTTNDAAVQAARELLEIKLSAFAVVGLEKVHLISNALIEATERAEAAEARVKGLEVALGQVVECGTTTETRRIGDAYDMDRGYDEFTVEHPCVEIARAALASQSEGK